jgi:hypothetical protein
MPSDQPHGNDGISHIAKLEREDRASVAEKQEQYAVGHA